MKLMHNVKWLGSGSHGTELDVVSATQSDSLRFNASEKLHDFFFFLSKIDKH